MTPPNRRRIAATLRRLRTSRDISMASARTLRNNDAAAHAAHIAECVWAARRYSAAIVATLRLSGR